ncbi:hypothetical protein D9M71_758400 [compost metagenome]
MGTQFVAEFFLPLGVGHQWQSPQITLGGLLEIQFGVEPGDRLVGWQFAFHGNFADASIKFLGAHAAAGEQGHQAETGCANCTVHIKVLIYRR